MSTDMTDISSELKGYPPILGLVGPLGCGKTSTADAIVALVKGRRLSCAGSIRNMLHALGIPHNDLTLHKNKPQPWLHNCTSRAMLKSLGTEWGREMVGPDIWINAVLRAAEQDGPRGAPVVCDDCRFDNETAAIKRAGGHVFFVYHPGVGYSYSHPSECGLSDWSVLDGVIDLETAKIVSPSKIVEWGYDDIIRYRPWWARWKWGRRLFGFKQPPTVAEGLEEPSAVASKVVEHWNLLTRNAASDYARILPDLSNEN